MKYRRFGRTNWNISEVGYGTWGMGEWSESDDKQSSNSLDIAVDGGVNFLIQLGLMVEVTVKDY